MLSRFFESVKKSTFYILPPIMKIGCRDDNLFFFILYSNGFFKSFWFFLFQ